MLRAAAPCRKAPSPFTSRGTSMALSELEMARTRRTLEAFMQRRRPPPHLRHEVDLKYRISGQVVELFEVRPVWDRPSEKMERPIAKATFIRTRNVWRVCWRRADRKWHLYEPAAEVPGLPTFLSVVEEDPHGCFWG